MCMRQIKYMGMLCQEYVLCMLKLNGYVIKDYDVWGFDILATDGEYDYYIEVKCGRGAGLTRTQRRTRNDVMRIPNARYVVCRFDEYGNLIEDELCRRLLTTPA